jgi:hypothetical protein
VTTQHRPAQGRAQLRINTRERFDQGHAVRQSGAPETEIEITPAMIAAGVAALSDWMVDGDSLVRNYRPLAARDIHNVMRMRALNDANCRGKSLDLISESAKGVDDLS